MTNHPRRVGRRKHQRTHERAQAAAADLAAQIARLGTSVIGASRDPLNPNRAALLWGNGRLDVIDTRPLWQKEPA